MRANSTARQLILSGLVAIAGSSIWSVAMIDRAMSTMARASESSDPAVLSGAARDFSAPMPPVAMLIGAVGWVALFAGAILLLRNRRRRDPINTEARE